MTKVQFEHRVLSKIDGNWTLFLDRDGVINVKRDNDYVKTVEEFIPIDGAFEAVADLSNLFGRTVVVTNQQGIGKGIMTHHDLDKVHAVMLKNINALQGEIDAVYYAPQLAAEESNMRKPNPGMAQKALQDFPDVVFSKSIMIGDSLSDMAFAKNAGIPHIFVTNNPEKYPEFYCVKSLHALHKTIRSFISW